MLYTIMYQIFTATLKKSYYYCTVSMLPLWGSPVYYELCVMNLLFLSTTKPPLCWRWLWWQVSWLSRVPQNIDWVYRWLAVLDYSGKFHKMYTVYYCALTLKKRLSLLRLFYHVWIWGVFITLLTTHSSAMYHASILLTNHLSCMHLRERTRIFFCELSVTDSRICP